MSFKELAAARYSVRKYDKRPVEQEKLDSILEVCRLAPTACNSQPQRIVVITEPEALQKLKGCTKYHFEAPAALLVCCDTSEAWRRAQDGHSSADVDGAIVGTHLMLQAADLGLGTCWVMSFDPEALRAAYGLTDSMEPVALFPLGYPAENSKPSHLHEDRKPVGETTVYEGF